ncbi:type II toxin-antitoxin system Phd/YefM family antitoxin [Methylocaldum sp.]|jgi:prevent-host-death family protein|uniref:type II toxin-antitoxin system Phd/YefM family antitoxin n=1 Tax=Methylocaldum sp. TaxID=1969727 RepID=UPI00321FFE50
MPYQVNVHEAKTQLSSLLARVEAGEEVIIARANKPIVRLIPYTAPKPSRRLGEAKGLVELKPDFEELPEDFMAYFE